MDHAALDQLRVLDDGGVGLIEEMVEMFWFDAPRRLVLAQEALESGNARALAEAAHALKSASSTLGALRLRQAAAEVEQLGRRGNLTETWGAMGNLHEVFK